MSSQPQLSLPWASTHHWVSQDDQGIHQGILGSNCPLSSDSNSPCRATALPRDISGGCRHRNCCASAPAAQSPPPIHPGAVKEHHCGAVTFALAGQVCPASLGKACVPGICLPCIHLPCICPFCPYQIIKTPRSPEMCARQM